MKFLLISAALLVCCAFAANAPFGGKHVTKGEQPKKAPATTASISADWKKTICELKTEPTLQVVVNPMIERGVPIHRNVYESLSRLRANHVRYVPWLPYPKLGVAELEPPTATSTSWNMTLIDPLMEDFMEAVGNGSVIINFSTPPTWMYDTDDWSYPANPDEVTWDYEKGTKLKSLQVFADYYSRLVQWYTEGGFTDEIGQVHTSGHKYNIQMWEVLNEVEAEHKNTPESYTQQYDAVVAALKKLSNGPKEFVGMALAYHNEWDWYNYFLNSSNHAADIPLDWISYHFYGSPSSRNDPLAFEQIFSAADGFAKEVMEIETIRKHLSPTTRTTIDEIGTILPDDNTPGVTIPPNSYWAASGGMYIYLFNELAKQQIDVLGESQLMGHPDVDGFAPQFPSVSLLDWNRGTGNPRYWVLHELLDAVRDHKHTMIETSSSTPDVAAQGYLRDDGTKWMLVVNKRHANITAEIPAHAVTYTMVTEDSFTEPPGVRAATGAATIKIQLPPFAVMFIFDLDD